MIINSGPVILDGVNAPQFKYAHTPAGVPIFAHTIPHGGVHLGGIAPENSLDSIMMAHRCGFKSVELDFYQTKDGVPVVNHDQTMYKMFRNKSDYSRVSPELRVNQLTYQELVDGYVLASNNIHMRRPMPTLEECFRLAASLGIRVVAEFHDITTPVKIKEVVDLGVEILGNANIAWQCFSTNVLLEVRKINPYVWLYPLSSNPTIAAFPAIEALKPCVYFVGRNVTKEVVQFYTDKGIKVAGWGGGTTFFQESINKGIFEQCNDSPAPVLDLSRAVARVASLDEATHTGTLSDGVLQLAEGETLTFNPDAVELGAYYASLYLSAGEGTIQATNHSLLSITAGAYATQSLIVDGTADVVFTAGVGGAVVDYVSFIQCQF